MFLLDSRGNCLLASPNADDILGNGTKAAMEGSPIFAWLHFGDHQNLARCLSDPASVKPFDCRFRRPDRPSSGSDHEVLQVTVAPAQQQQETAATATPMEPALGSILRDCRAVCVARRVPERERNQHFAVELFTTKLDPATGFRVRAVDTTGMNTTRAEDIARRLLNQPLAECTHTEADRATLRTHLEATVRDGSDVSPIYHLCLFEGVGDGSWARVRTKSQLFRPAPQVGNFEPSFVMATHSVIAADADLRPLPAPARTLPPFSAQQASGAIAGANAIQQASRGITRSKTSPSPSNNNTVKKQGPEGTNSSRDLDTEQKNLLLKQLLNVNFSRKENEGGDAANAKPKETSTSSSSSRILQLLSQASPESSAASTSGVTAGVKRPATSTIASLLEEGETPAKVPVTVAKTNSQSPPSSVLKQNPSLANLLARPMNNPVSVPPPVPSKWHQEPKEKLPKSKGGAQKFLQVATTTVAAPAIASPSLVKSPSPSVSATATVTSPQLTNTSPAINSSVTFLPTSPPPNVTVTRSVPPLPPPQLPPPQAPPARLPPAVTESDPMLSEILDGVIDIQEKSPGSGSTSKRENMAEIETIEKFLASSEATAHGRQSSSLLMPLTQPQRPYPGGGRVVGGGGAYGSVQTVAGTHPGGSAIAVASDRGSRRPSGSLIGSGGNSGGSPMALMPRMSELLRAVPPNVSAPPQELEGHELQAVLQQQQRRRSASGGPMSPAEARSGLLQRLQSVPVPLVQQQQPQQPQRLILQQQPQHQQQHQHQHHHQPQLQPQPRPPSTNLLMQQLSSGPLTVGVESQSLANPRHASFGNGNGHGPPPNNFGNSQEGAAVSTTFQQLPQQPRPLLSSAQSHLRPQLPPHRPPSTGNGGGGGNNGNGDDHRSLLQQLLSE